jgi:hypothetical protein
MCLNALVGQDLDRSPVIVDFALQLCICRFSLGHKNFQSFTFYLASSEIAWRTRNFLADLGSVVWAWFALSPIPMKLQGWIMTFRAQYVVAKPTLIAKALATTWSFFHTLFTAFAFTGLAFNQQIELIYTVLADVSFVQALLALESIFFHKDLLAIAVATLITFIDFSVVLIVHDAHG